MSLPGWITAASQALILIDQIEDRQLTKASREELINLGQRLWWIVKHANETLEVIKERMRQDAGKASDTTRFESGDSHVMVIPQTPTLEVKKDADIEALKRLLGSRFDEYFEKVVTYKPRKDFRERLAQAAKDATTTKAALDVVTVNPRAARVVFKD